VVPGFEISVCNVASLSRDDLVDSADAEDRLAESVEFDGVKLSGHANDCAVVPRFKFDVTDERDISAELIRRCRRVVVGQVPGSVSGDVFKTALKPVVIRVVTQRATAQCLSGSSDNSGGRLIGRSREDDR